MKRFLYIIIITACTVLLSSCLDFTAPESAGDVALSKGTVNLVAALSRLDNPYGIMPETLGLSESEYPKILSHSIENYHEFFAFDKNQCVIVLSADPLYFMVINSPEFYRHLNAEYEQIAAGVTPNNKELNTVDNYKRVGDYEVGIFFTPNEMKYHEGRFQDSVSTTYVDPYRLYGAAKKLWFYTPSFKEESIYTDLLEKWLADRDAVIQYTRGADFSDSFDDQYITYYTRDDIYLNFTFFIGQDLELTDELQGTKDIDFENQIELTRDFSIFLSTPLGNSQESAEAYLSNQSASSRHGICVVIRGEQDYFRTYLAKENVDFDPSDSLPLSLAAKDNYASETLTLDWGVDNGSMNLWIRTGDEEYPQTPSATVNGSSHDVNISRGNQYTFKLTQADDDSLTLAEASTYFTDLVVTEICYWGTSYPGTVNDDEIEQRGSNADDWIEIRNISKKAVNLSDLLLYVYNSNKKRSVWFSPYESGNYEPLDMTLMPGERTVLSNDSKTEFFFNYYTPPSGKILNRIIRGTKSGIFLGENYTLQLLRGEHTLQKILISGEYGEKAPFKTMVLDKSGSWQTSTVNSGTNPTEPLGRNTQEMLYNFCTPGYAADDEL